MCETANQQSISSHVVVYMACKMRCRWLTFRRCFVNRALSRNRSLRDADPARHLFVWFAKHCLAEHCLSFRGDTDECEKQFCFVFRICLAFFDSRLWRPLASKWRRKTLRAWFGTHVSQSEHSDRPRRIKKFIQIIICVTYPCFNRILIFYKFTLVLKKVRNHCVLLSKPLNIAYLYHSVRCAYQIN